MTFVLLPLLLSAFTELPLFQAGPAQPFRFPPSLPPSQRALQPGLPMVQPDPTDPADKLIRTARSSIFTASGPLLPLDTASNFHFLAIVDMKPMPELPVNDEFTDLVVYGQIADRKAFVTSRKRGIYMDYDLKIGRVLKPLDSIRPASTISVLRLGGLAKLPSGGTIEQEIRGYGPEPAVGSEYLFFLRALPPPAEAYTILKFWNIKNQADGSKVVTAAFDADIAGAQNKTSPVDGRPLSEVEEIVIKTPPLSK